MLSRVRRWVSTEQWGFQPAVYARPAAFKGLRRHSPGLPGAAARVAAHRWATARAAVVITVAISQPGLPRDCGPAGHITGMSRGREM
jgi:hypothetical protein